MHIKQGMKEKTRNNSNTLKEEKKNKVIEGEKPSCSIHIDDVSLVNGKSERYWAREKCGERTQNGLFKRD